MARGKERYFGEVAIQKGFITPEQLSEGLALQAEYRKLDIYKPIGAILHDKDYLSLVQIRDISEEVAGRQRRESIEGYEILSKLGKGGMGSVYLARQLSLNKLVAIKILPPHLAHNEAYLHRFHREAEATARLDHPNIVRAIDFGESGGYHYFVMEYVDGDTVKHQIGTRGVVPEEEAVAITLQMAQALEHAWTFEIIHRDIKPANIMLTREGQAKLCDLGLAVEVKQHATITQSGIVMGTPYYLSPEQARAEKLDIRSDLYSLGATLFHMVTGAPPFDGESPAVIVSKHLTEPAPDPQERNPIISRHLADVIQRLLAKEKAARFQSPGELAAAMQDILAVLERQAEAEAARRPFWKPDRSTVRLIRQGLVATVAALVLTGIFHPGMRSYLGQKYEQLLVTLADLPRLDEKTRSDKEAVMAQETSAREGYELADAYFSRHADDLPGALERFDRVASAFPTSSFGRKAAHRVEQLREQLDEEAKHHFLSLKEEARQLTAEGVWHYGQAIELFASFPHRYRSTIWPQAALKERNLLEQEATELGKQVFTEAEQRFSQGQVRVAIGLLEPLTETGIPAIDEEATARLGHYRQFLPAESTPSISPEGRTRLLQSAWDRIREQLLFARQEAEGPAPALRTLLITLLEDPELEPVYPELGQLQADLSTLWELEARLLAALQERVGTELSLTLSGVERSGVLTGATRDDIRLEQGGRPLAFPLWRLDVGEVDRLVQPELAPERLQLVHGLAQLLDGRTKEAVRLLREAGAAGADVGCYQPLFE